MAFGGVTASLGAVMLDPCALHDDKYDRRRCRRESGKPDPELGAKTIASGAVFVVIGAILYATTLDWTPPKPKPWPIRPSTNSGPPIP